MRYLVSKIVPVRFTSVYRPSELPHQTKATWWQWRDHCFRVRHTPIVP